MLDAAATVFSRRGYHRATVDEIADAVGISKPMVYLYFGSKEELFVAVVDREAERLNRTITEAVAVGTTPYEQLRCGLEAFLTFVAEHRDGWSVLYRRARSQGGPVARGVSGIRTRTIDTIARLLEQAIRDTGADLPPRQDLVAMAHAIVGGCEALADWMLDVKAVDPTVMADRVIDLSWFGLSGLFDIPSRSAGPTSRG
jgi:AcrR family transcriptional regulator